MSWLCSPAAASMGSAYLALLRGSATRRYEDRVHTAVLARCLPHGGKLSLAGQSLLPLMVHEDHGTLPSPAPCFWRGSRASPWWHFTLRWSAPGLCRPGTG